MNRTHNRLRPQALVPFSLTISLPLNDLSSGPRMGVLFEKQIKTQNSGLESRHSTKIALEQPIYDWELVRVGYHLASAVLLDQYSTTPSWVAPVAHLRPSEIDSHWGPPTLSQFTKHHFNWIQRKRKSTIISALESSFPANWMPHLHFLWSELTCSQGWKLTVETARALW